MESYQPPQHGYPPPPPPPPPPPMVSDPQFSQHHHYQQQQQQQYQQHQYQQYHQQQQQQPPPPPPPPPPSTSAWYQHPPHQKNQWGPPPPPPPPYSAHPHPPYPAPLPSYSNQDYGNGNWTHHPGWEYPVAHTEGDWAAKAKAWASARSSMENQQPQPVVRQEDPSPYANQYPQSVGSHYQDNQQSSVPTSGFSSYQGHVPPAVHQQEPSSVSSYASESHVSFAVKDQVISGDTSVGFAHHQGQTNSTAYQQEVPSSYSSIPGNGDGLHGKLHGNSLLPADGRVMLVDHPQFAHGNHSLDQMNQPFEFASRYSHDIDNTMMSSYPDSSGPVRGTGSVSDHTWTVPAAPGASYPPAAPGFPSIYQYDPVGVPPIPGQQSPLFGGGPGFQPPVPTHAGLSGGIALHPASAFSVDGYGVPSSSERPKKAAVPNWLREEIIKTKTTIARSAPEHFKEGSQDIEDELVDKPIGIGDQEDTKSIDSARSTEEDDDEDEEGAQRTAAINQEIKRVLTEVLLKVTDELFDEIATKVLSEDDHISGVVGDSVPVPEVSPPPPPSVSSPKESEEVTIKAKVKEREEHASGDTSSGSPVNLLGLSNYASDEDDEIQAPSIPKFDSNGAHGASENALQTEAEDRPIGVHTEHTVPASNSNDHTFSKDLTDNKDIPSDSGPGSTVSVQLKGNVIGDAAKSTGNDHKETVNGPDIPVEKLRTSARDSSQDRGAKRHDRHDSKRSSSGRDNYKETESSRVRGAEKDKIFSERDERHKKKDNTEDGKREREGDKKLRSPRHEEKARKSDSGKSSKYEKTREKSRSSKDDGDKKRERTKEEKNDKSRHKSSDAGRHKRRRSSSVSSRGKAKKENPILSNGSSDEVSEDSRRRKHSKRRNLSPSPVRRKQRKVLRSPRSKHTQQRHSPYSSLDDSRDRRSRSPERRHRR
ncbi:hypothetical protein RND81_11G013300 [Saponaria officinalis]|uniref:Uncharacterized protein n=1 Tax=Saponaria officinalis TaxID=3572 RepID=A0AAW1HGZ6_SAPOF